MQTVFARAVERGHRPLPRVTERGRVRAQAAQQGLGEAAEQPTVLGAERPFTLHRLAHVSKPMDDSDTPRS